MCVVLTHSGHLLYFYTACCELVVELHKLYAKIKSCLPLFQEQAACYKPAQKIQHICELMQVQS